MKLFFLTLFALVYMHDSYADLGNGVCSFHLREAGAPLEVEEILSSYRYAKAVKLCSVNDTNIYFLVSEINTYRDLSYYSLTRVFSGKNESEGRWVLTPNRYLSPNNYTIIYMCPRNKECLKYDSGKYIATKNISFGVFEKVVMDLMAIFKSEESSNLFFSSVRGEKETNFLMDAIRNKSDFNIVSIKFFEPRFSSQEKTGYLVHVSNQKFEWEIAVDFWGENLKLIGLGMYQ